MNTSLQSFLLGMLFFVSGACTITISIIIWRILIRSWLTETEDEEDEYSPVSMASLSMMNLFVGFAGLFTLFASLAIFAEVWQ